MSYRKTDSALTLVAEIILGLREGYDGRVHDVQEVVDFLEAYNAASIGVERPFISFRVSETTIVHGHGAGCSQKESSAVLTGMKSPVYDVDKPDGYWKQLVEDYAEVLAREFRQFQVYVVYREATVVIVQATA